MAILGIPQVFEIPIASASAPYNLVVIFKLTHFIVGRGTVVSGRIEQGTIKPGEEIEVLGLVKGRPLKTTVTIVEIFKKLLDHAEAGDNVGLLLRGLKREDVQRGQVHYYTSDE
ncbi:hypothetical protein KSS87_006040 [Heliosperma pusillum]|nr:hypothetical protein KSS87_017212 [Heliosperma pusillum]KAH9625796.1 hypothetical protein KSS87_006040 [Heliosperma pusillum]